MGLIFFIVFLFMHIAFGLAIAFFVLYLAEKTERGWLRTLGSIIGWLLIVLALLALITGTGFAIKKRQYMGNYINEKSNHETIMNQETNLKKNKTKDQNEKNISYYQNIRKSGKGCPVKTKSEIEKELKQGKKTGGACSVDIKKGTKSEKSGPKYY